MRECVEPLLPRLRKKKQNHTFIYMLEEYYRLRGWDEDGKPLKMPGIEG